MSSHPRLFLFFLALVFSFFACFFFSGSTSFLYPANNADSICLDSNLFLYEASLWLMGKRPYLDFYDHKGLYHLAIDVIGIAIDGRYGVFLLQLLFDALSLFGLFLSFKLLHPNYKLLAVLGGLLFAFFYAMGAGGNNEGEWVLPFVSLFASAYVFGIVQQKPRAFLLGSFAMGLDVGLALNSRPVDGIYGALGAFFFLIYSLKHRQFLALLENALIAIAGCAIPFAIFYPLAIAQGFEDLMVKAIFVQSFSYLLNSFSGITLLVWGYKIEALAVAALLGLFFFFERREVPEQGDLSFFFFFVGVAADLIFFVILGYGHYFQSGFGFVSLALLYGFSHWPKIKVGASLRFVSAFLVIFLAGDLGYFSIVYYTPEGLNGYSYSETQEMAKTIVAMKEQGAGEKGSVFAIDLDCAFYIQGDFVVNERYLSFPEKLVSR